MKRIVLPLCLFLFLAIGIGEYGMGQKLYAGWDVMPDADAAKITGYGCRNCYNMCGQSKEGDCPDKRCEHGNGGTCGAATTRGGGVAYICANWGSARSCSMSGTPYNSCYIKQCDCNAAKKCVVSSSEDYFSGPPYCFAVN